MKWLSRLWPGRAPANTARRSPRQQTAVRRNTSLGSGHLQYASSPLLAAKTPLWRARLVVLGVGVGFLVLLGRAVYIQVIGTEFYQKQGESRYARTFELPASRGRITDRHGQILAASVPAPSIWAIPKDFRPDAKQQQALLRLLGMTSRELATRLADNPNFVWLRRQVDESVAAQVKALGIKGLHQQREFRRQYPEGESAAHVVGFTNLEERGQEGIELAFQKELEGRAGSRSVVRDRLGRIVEDIGESREPVDGSDLALALDSKVQFFAYQRVRDAVLEHNAKAGSVVVLDVLTGEVLALANYPSYVPGERQGLSGAQLRNRAVTDTFEPGSTMKPFIAALALQTGRVTPDTVIQTAPGRIHFGSATISDSHPHGLLSVEQVIQKSSNVGTVKMAMQMEPREMWEMFSSVGIGQKPQLAFPGLASGRLRPYKSWRPVEQATMSYGYGLSVSLLQLARAYTVFARDGQLMPVTMLKNEVPAAGVQVFSPEVARSVRHMLNMAAAPGGTAPKAQAIGYSVGGKTGTAHKQEGGSYVSNKYRAWFVGIAPVSNPRIVVAVMVDEPGNGRYFGGDVAAPVFSQVVQQSLRMLGVPPDLEVQPQIVARAQAVKAEEESF
ncbi:Peptidoglycan glycosyltransferase [Leptothrix cholodnii SP-6]|uniref:Peptidoglycan D,D-transpeptidase FtsI n=1 Tax=Leptothrix cholodnii (strain ATCC 51168 / LMG 8142 / SP-6) TaxID=395495 RepID=B1XY22_LEPCP|nr:penicillin-binding protein 2 [Leptothrix cholodnii]ACB32791.1 Peptidoglycan glycosyltransferase [Leptothrix cholodnii SP-6]